MVGPRSRAEGMLRKAEKCMRLLQVFHFRFLGFLGFFRFLGLYFPLFWSSQIFRFLRFLGFLGQGWPELKNAHKS